MSSIPLPDTRITLSESVPAGSFKLPLASSPPQVQVTNSDHVFKSLPAFCRIAAIIEPVKDSEIKIEVWMPQVGWNERFLAVGNGGWAGSISYEGLAQSLQRGYATASTDTGHSGRRSGALFAYGHPEKLVDFGYRSVHLMTTAAKAIITAFYGNGPRRAYWNGCSTGGKQGLTEAQRFPDDYDGIVEGDPASFGHT